MTQSATLEPRMTRIGADSPGSDGQREECWIGNRGSRGYSTRMPKDAPLERLQRWYDSRCDGRWEHDYGIEIETCDNPGWLVRIDLPELEEHYAMSLVARPWRRGAVADAAWLVCEATACEFAG